MACQRFSQSEKIHRGGPETVQEKKAGLCFISGHVNRPAF
jgi:hypothetical protein